MASGAAFQPGHSARLEPRKQPGQLCRDASIEPFARNRYCGVGDLYQAPVGPCPLRVGMSIGKTSNCSTKSRFELTSLMIGRATQHRQPLTGHPYRLAVGYWDCSAAASLRMAEVGLGLTLGPSTAEAGYERGGLGEVEGDGCEGTAGRDAHPAASAAVGLDWHAADAEPLDVAGQGAR